MDSGKRQPGFFLLDGILAVFLLGAAALSFAAYLMPPLRFSLPISLLTVANTP